MGAAAAAREVRDVSMKERSVGRRKRKREKKRIHHETDERERLVIKKGDKDSRCLVEPDMPCDSSSISFQASTTQKLRTPHHAAESKQDPTRSRPRPNQRQPTEPIESTASSIRVPAAIHTCHIGGLGTTPRHHPHHSFHSIPDLHF